MKKKRSRLISLLLTLAMVLSLVPATAWADSAKHPEFVKVTNVSGTVVSLAFDSDDKTCLANNNATEATTHTAGSSDYVAWYDKTTGTLHLNGYKGGRIEASGKDDVTLTIVLENENTITYTKTDNRNSSALELNLGNATIEGSGSLKITANENKSDGYELRGIDCRVLSVEGNANVEVNVTGGIPKGVYVGKGLSTSDSMKLTITTAGKAGDGICGYTSNESDRCEINLAGGTTTITNKAGGDGIYNLRGNITVKSKLDINGASGNGIKLGESGKTPDGVITFSDGADVTIQNSYHGVAAYIDAKSGEDKADVKINGGKLKITNTTSDSRPAGIYSANNGVAISGGTVEIEDDCLAMDLPKGTVDISGNANVNLKGNSDSYGAVYTNSAGTIALSEGGKVTATSKKVNSTFGVAVQLTDTIPTDGTIMYGDGSYDGKDNGNGTYTATFIYSDNIGSATVKDITVDGIVGKTLSDSKKVQITLTDAKFKSVAGNTDVSGWFINLPDGLTAKLDEYGIRADTDGAEIYISGTPTAQNTDVIKMKIPADVLNITKHITVTENTKAKYNICEIISSVTVTVNGPYAGQKVSDAKKVTVAETDKEKYTATVKSWKDGSWRDLSEDTVFSAGETYSVVIDITPKSGYQIEMTATAEINGKNATYNSAEDHVWAYLTANSATAEKTLTGIEVTKAPYKTNYEAGENFDPTDMVVKATYSNGTTAEVTTYTVTDGTNLTAGKTSVTISYTEGGITKTTTQTITVNSAPVSSDLTFEHKAEYDIPAGRHGTIALIDVSEGVTGGKEPYEFKKVSGPDWLTVYTKGRVEGIRPSVDTEATTATIRVTDADGNTADMTINIGAVNSEKTKVDFPTAYTSLVYNGTEQYGVPESSGYERFSDCRKVAAGHYTGTVKLNDGFEWSDGNTETMRYIEFDIAKKTPEVSDFNVGLPTQLEYNGNTKYANVSMKSVYSRYGTVTTKYNGSTDLPVEVGNYVVTVDVAGGDNFNAITALKVGSFTIEKARPYPTYPTNLKGKKGKPLSTVALPTDEKGTWAWKDSTTVMNTVGEQYFATIFTPNDTAHYKTVDDITLEVTVEETTVTPTDPVKPTITIPNANTTYFYNGTEQTVTVNGYDSATMNIVGNKGTDTGTYTVKVTSKTGKWADGSTDAVTKTWYMNPERLTAPAFTKTSFEKTGSEINIMDYVQNFDDTKMYVTSSGTTKATNAGTYTFTIGVKAQDGTNDYTKDSNYEILTASGLKTFVKYTWEITESETPDPVKITITDTLVPVSDLTKTFEYNKTKEPTFGGTLTKDTDYTVSYAVKTGSAGELKDGKPYGAGTYVVTVTGIGSYKDSFTKDFVIEKLNLADENIGFSAKAGEEKTEGIYDEDIADLKLGSLSAADSDGILDGTPELIKTSELVSLKFKFKTDAEAGKTATVTIPLTDTNYVWNLVITLTVEDGGSVPVEKVAVIPTAKAGLVYNGSEQTGVEAGEGYTLSRTFKATDAGDYTATATLNTGYKWNDNTTAPKTIPWSIDKAAQGTPSSLTGIAPTTEGGSDGKITGTTAEMEYSTDATFTLKFDCADTETTGLTAGTYYVRYKENANHYAGNAATVTVGEGTPVTTYTLTVNSGTGSGDYAENVIVTIQANSAETGKQFKEWTGLDGVEFVDGTSKTSATAKFKMPAETVTATATYEDVAAPVEKHTVTAYGLYGDTMIIAPGTTYKADYAKDERVALQIGKRSGYTLKDLTLVGISESDLTWTAKNEEINDRGISFTMPDHNVTITVNWTKNSSGSSGGGGGSSVTKYAVTVSSADNGKITLDKTSAAKGSVVTITAKANDGYELDTIKATDKDGKEIKLTDKGDGKYTFTMSASKVEVKAAFKQIASKPDQPAEETKTVVVMQIGSKTIFVNGKAYEKDAAPVIMNDRTLVPIRFVTESLGGKVVWNAETKEVTLVIDGKEIKMTIGKTLEKYGVAPVIINDRTFVPVRFVADELGATTAWDAASKTVTITKTEK